MSTAIKVCGVTRTEDLQLLAALAVHYVGAIRAGGPRLVTRAQWRTLMHSASPSAPRRVAVIGDVGVKELFDEVLALTPDVVQWHGEPTIDDVRVAGAWLRARGVELWGVVRVDGAILPPRVYALSPFVDAIVLDAKVPGVLGGSGVPLDWQGLAHDIAAWRAAHPTVRFVLAGGLNSEQVAHAMALLHPDVVDVSSGVECAPGVKDADRVRAFVRAVRGE